MIRNEIRKQIELIFREIFGDSSVPDFSIEIPENPEHGDYSTNIAFVIARTLAKRAENAVSPFRPPWIHSEKIRTGDVLWQRISSDIPAKPIDIAGYFAQKLRSGIDLFSKIEVFPPGFVNFFLSPDAIRREMSRILTEKELYGRAEPRSEKVNVEFVSANPTGPLTLANGRGGFLGDVLSNVLSHQGYEVTREYYVNDAGNQIRLLAESIQAAEGKIPEKEEYYKGEYIKELAGKSAEEAAHILLEGIKKSLSGAGISFDSWFSENENLRKSGAIDRALQFLSQKNLLETRDGAVWLGERVLLKSDGEPTYLLADLAYHRNKLIERNFNRAITIVGADHHAEISFVKKSMTEFFGVSAERLYIIVMQLVRLVSGGAEVRMSKRKGTYVTLDELIEEVGVDAARYFFLERAPETHMDFDMDLAREHSVKNPVYYIQYAHARMCSVFEKAGGLPREAGASPADSLELLKSPDEFSLIKKLIQFPEIVEDIAKDYHVHRMPRYAYELARTFHNFYEKERIIGEDKNLMAARLALVEAAQIVLRNTLNLMGISAPERM